MVDMSDFLVVMEKELHASDVEDIKYLFKDTLSGSYLALKLFNLGTTTLSFFVVVDASSTCLFELKLVPKIFGAYSNI